jgi:hypothetical protein
MIGLRKRVVWTTLGALLLSASTLPAAPSEPSEGSGLPASLLPDDTTVVVTFNFKQLRASRTFEKYGAKTVQDCLKLLAELYIPEWGIDPLETYGRGEINAGLLAAAYFPKSLEGWGLDSIKDIDTLTWALSCEVTAAFDSATRRYNFDYKTKTLVIITGTFDVAKTHAPDDAKVVNTKDPSGSTCKIYQIAKLDPFIIGTTFVGIDKTAVLISENKELVADALAKVAGKKSTQLREKKLQPLLDQADTKQTVCFVILPSGLARIRKATGFPVSDEFEKIENITGGIRASETIKIEFVVIAKDAEGAKEIAKNISEGIDGMQQMFSLYAAQFKSLAPAFDVVKRFESEVKDKTVTIRNDVSAEQLDKVIQGFKDLIEQRQKGTK